MDVDFDFSDVDSFFNEGEWEVEKKMIDVGDETLKNEAEYASFVESKGFDVLSSAALYAEKRLKEEFER